MKAYYFANYDDAVEHALRNATSYRCDWGIAAAHPGTYCDVTPVNEHKKYTEANWRIFLLPAVRYRQGHELSCEVVVPSNMTDDEQVARGLQTSPEYQEVNNAIVNNRSVRRIGSTVEITGYDAHGNPRLITRNATSGELTSLPHSVRRSL